MSDAILRCSKFPKKNDYYYSFDVVEYKNTYHTGLNLYKNFNNYLAGVSFMSVVKFNCADDAYKYFNDFEF